MTAFTGLIIALGLRGGSGIIFGIVWALWDRLSSPPAMTRMREIAAAIQQGATAYLNRQYTTIAVVGAILFVALGFALHWTTAIGFAVGAMLSGLAGYIGMNVSVRANVRTAEAARTGLNEALAIAFRGGAITGLLVVGSGCWAWPDFSGFCSTRPLTGSPAGSRARRWSASLSAVR